jgi:hypothetical protein
MAIVKATYTKSLAGAKAAIRYIQHRPGKDGQRAARELYGTDGVMERSEAYQMIDAAGKGSVFFRIVISPDPQTEDSERDLRLSEITAQTMLHLAERLMPRIGMCMFSPVSREGSTRRISKPSEKPQQRQLCSSDRRKTKFGNSSSNSRKERSGQCRGAAPASLIPSSGGIAPDRQLLPALPHSSSCPVCDSS